MIICLLSNLDKWLLICLIHFMKWNSHNFPIEIIIYNHNRQSHYYSSKSLYNHMKTIGYIAYFMNSLIPNDDLYIT